MAKINAKDIIDKVERHERDTVALRSRFEDDWALYTLEENLPPDPPGHEGENEDFRKHTTPDPQTYADKIVSWSVMAQQIIRIPEHSEERHKREIDNLKELFAIGVLNAADERLINLGLPTVRDSVSFFGAIRGPIIARVLIAKRLKDGSSYVDITPFDPLYTYWGYDNEGLAWCCYKSDKTKLEIEGEYGVKLSGGMEDDEKETVYNYYDREHNTVVIEDREPLKKSTVHGSPRVPIAIVFAGSAPPIQSTKVSDTDRHYSESVFKSIREVSQNYNLLMSIALELSARARKPPITYTSESGEKVPEAGLFETGKVTSLAAGEKIDKLELLELTRDATAFIALVSGEIQRGSLPYSAYGEIAFQLSGYAITQLRQGIDSVIQPRLRTLENFYKQALRLLVDQYVTGAFKPIEVSGEDRNRKWFSREITPEDIKEGCDLNFKLVGELPSDDQAKVAMAKMLDEGEVPLVPRRYIWDEVLEMQNTDQMADMLKEQMAERGAPLAQLYNMFDAAVRQGRETMAAIYWDEIQVFMAQKEMELAQLGIRGGAPLRNGAQNGGPPQPGMGMGMGPGGPPQPGMGMGPMGPPPPGMGMGPMGPPPPGMGMGPMGPLPPGMGMAPGFAPQVQPNIAFTGAPPPPTPQGGPLVPPGQPRPGAQSEDARRLMAMGLIPA